MLKKLSILSSLLFISMNTSAHDTFEFIAKVNTEHVQASNSHTSKTVFINNAVKEVDITINNINPVLPGYDKLIIEGDSTEAITKALLDSGLYKTVELDFEVSNYSPVRPTNNSPNNSSESDLPNDPLLGDQKIYLDKQQESDIPFAGTFSGHNIYGAWGKVRKNKITRVGVIDGGFQRKSDLAFGDESFDTIDNTNNAFSIDDQDMECNNWHGTAVAHVIGAKTNNNMHIAAVDKNTNLIAVKALDCGSGRLSDVAKSIRWLSKDATLPLGNNQQHISEKVSVINMSLTGLAPYGTPCPSYLQEAIDFAHSQGVINVAAAGNDATSDQESVPFPAACNNVVSIGAQGTHGDLADFSNYGQNIDIIALGESVTGYALSYSEETIGWWDGTSFSAPIVSGIISLIRGEYPNATHEQILAAIKATAYQMSEDSECTTRGNVCGAGAINAESALDDVAETFSDLIAEIKPAFLNVEECDKDLVMKHVKLDYPVCEHYTVEISKGSRNDKPFAMVYKTLKGESTPTNAINVTKYLPLATAFIRVTQDDIDNYDWTYQNCTEHECEPTHHSLEVLPKITDCDQH